MKNMEKREPALGAPLNGVGGLEKGLQGPPTHPKNFPGALLHRGGCHVKVSNMN